MAPLPFFKMQGCGNDYVYVDAIRHPVADPAVLARRVANRHYGVGSDGLILLERPTEAAPDGAVVRMVMFNADGSESEMCGNGIRCLARLAHEQGHVESTDFVVETGAGPRRVQLIEESGQVVGATVEMGRPRHDRAAVPMAGEGSAVEASIRLGQETIVGTGISMGNPHFVIFPSSPITDELVHGLGRMIETHEAFPERVNVEFVELISPTVVRMRVWERGSGETLACGTGASAVLAAGVLTGRTQRKILCHLKGGDLELHWPMNEGPLLMTGPATMVFRGELLVG